MGTEQLNFFLRALIEKLSGLTEGNPKDQQPPKLYRFNFPRLSANSCQNLTQTYTNNDEKLMRRASNVSRKSFM